MNIEAIKKIRSRSKNTLKLMNFISWGAIILLVVSIGLLIWASFLPQEAFHAEKGVANWSLNFAISEQGSANTIVPFSVLQPLSTDMFQAKSAFITFYLFSILTFILALLYGVKLVKSILLSISDNHTPFTNQNAIRFRNLALVIIGYSLLGDIIVNIAIVLFVTHIFNINLMNISLSGLIIGSLLLIVSQIFRYGAYLQEEFDTTL